MDAVYIQTLILSTVKSSQRNTNQKAGETPESVRKGQRSHREKGREQEDRADGGGEWFKPAVGLLRFLRKFWEVPENDLQIILESIRYYLREPWGSKNRIYLCDAPSRGRYL